MRFSAILFLGISLHVTAVAHSQNVTVSAKNVSLENVFRQIRNQTGYTFVYRQEWMEQTNKVNLDLANAPLKAVLDSCFKNQPFSYSIVRKTIVLREREAFALLPERELAQLAFEDVIIRGRVTDEEGGAVAGASVVLKGTKTGTSTDKNGEFSLSLKEATGTLVITFVGFDAREMKVSEFRNGSPTIKLRRSQVKMDEVTVTTGIFNRKKESFTGAHTTVTAEQLESFGNRNLITSLRNIDPSFNIIESNSFGSNPNRLPEIQIRGNSSLPNVDELQDETRVGLNTPLIILDGFQSSLQRLLDINQNEVESITMLKDAAATAIYGSRGANGVIVIKTKAPKGGKLRLTYRADLNIEAPDITAYDLLGAREKLELEYKVGLYNNARAEQDLPLKQYYNFLLNEVNKGVETDWLSKPLRTGVGQRHNIRMEGGDDKFRYSISAQMNDIQGVMKESYRRTFNGTINLNYNYRDFRFTNNLIIGLGNSQESPYGSFSEYVRMNPYWSPYDEKGKVKKLLGDPGSSIYSGRWNTLPTNPLYNANLNTFDKDNSTTITNNFSIEWNIDANLTLRGRFGVTKSANESDVFKPADHTDFANVSNILRRGTYDFGTGKGFNYDGSINLSYFRQFDRHAIFAGADYNIRQNKNSYYEFRAEGFNNPNFDFIGMALQYQLNGKPYGTESLTRSVGLTGNVNYTYNQRYYVDLSLRSDGSSQFGRLNRFAPFWSLGLGWNLHEEATFKQYDFLNRLKLRGSMGTTGSDNFNAYQALSTYRYYTDDRYFSWTGAYLLGLGNENLKWQQKMNYDIGIDADLFDKKVSIVADYYLTRTNGLISSVDLPSSNGFTSYVENIGRVENKGFEFKATVFVLRNQPKRFSWSVSGAMVSNVNKVVHISDALKKAQKGLENASGPIPTTLYKEGYSTKTIWVVPSLGIDPSTGKELYLDVDGNPTYTWSSKNLTASGIEEPKYFGNFSTNVRYKNFTLNVSFGYRFGGQVYNQTLINKVENAEYRYNVDSRVYDNRWQKPGDNAAFKGLLVTAATNKTSRFVQDEKTVTMQNAYLQYEVNKKFAQKLKMQNLNFSANFSDLFYLSTVRRERGTSYPFSRQFSFTLNAIF